MMMFGCAMDAMYSSCLEAAMITSVIAVMLSPLRGEELLFAS